MKQYIGTKIIQAEPAVNIGGEVYLKSAPVPIIEGATELDGYKVVYPDGYESWSPKEVFEEAYRETTGMPFGLAIEAAKMGKKIARTGWNGKGMYVFLANEISFCTGADLSEFNPNRVEEHNELNAVEVDDAMVIRTAQGTLQPGWLASQADMLEDDWFIID